MPNKNNAAPKRNTANRNVVPTRSTSGNSKVNNTVYKTSQRKLGHIIKSTFQIITLCVLLTVAIGIFYFYHAYGKIILQLQAEAKQKISSSTEDTFRAVQTSLVYDAQGNLISKIKAEKDVYYIKYGEIPTFVTDAMIESEDRKFLEHGGVDYWANVRAAIALIKHKGEITQGASTITQQLARNVFLTHNVTYERKIEEIFIAQELEKKYSKSEIMEYYLNEIYFANGHYGIQAAAQGYFGDGIKSLSLSQVAFLCAIPNNPNLYNPLTNMDNTLNRRDRILLQMYKGGKISEAEYQTAINEKIELKLSKQDKKNYVETYVYSCAIRALMKDKGFEFYYQFDSEKDKTAYDKAYEDLYYSCQKDLYIKGYRIYTSIDLEKERQLQASVDDALKDFTEVNKEGVYKMQGAAVCIDNDTGKVIAIVGGREQDLGGYTLNRAYQSYRQPGSSIKPLIVYTPSFERNYTPQSTVVDEYIKGGPRNASDNYSGKIKLQQAIEASKNTIAWKLFEELTPQVGMAYLMNMNFAKISSKDYVPAAALGGFTVGVSPVEMAAGYATIENDGYYREPTCIVKITDSEGGVIVEDSAQTEQIYQTNAARIMTEVLTGVVKNGTAKGLGLTNTISAGKTGTTNDKKDGWFVGYTPYYTTSVWVGYDMPKTVDNLKGATYPGTIWHNYMEQLHTPSMTATFQLYDWRTVLKAQKDAEKKAKAKAAALLTQAAEEENNWENTDPQGNQNIQDENDGQTTAEDSVEDIDPDASEVDTNGDVDGETPSDDTEVAPEEDYSGEDVWEDTNDDEGTGIDNIEDGTTEDGTIEDGTTEDGTTEDGTIEDGTTEGGTIEDGTNKDGITED